MCAVRVKNVAMNDPPNFPEDTTANNVTLNATLHPGQGLCECSGRNMCVDFKIARLPKILLAAKEEGANPSTADAKLFGMPHLLTPELGSLQLMPSIPSLLHLVFGSFVTVIVDCMRDIKKRNQLPPTFSV